MDTPLPTWIAALILVFCGGLCNPSASAQKTVNCYCSLDRPISEAVLLSFEKQTGIKVAWTFDTEATKTVGLVNRIISERSNPRCDVYWNNELAQTIRLKNEGLLQPYRAPNAASIPAGFKDPEGYWTGFAARARVLIYNRDLMGDDPLPRGLHDLLDARWDGKMSMAKPLTGTTLTHAAALFSVWGEEKAKQFFRDIRKRQIYFSRGNAMSMKAVGEGEYHWSWTDTDDANVALINNKPTAMVIPDQGDGEMGTLVIPNSVAIIAGAKNLSNAKKLVDYLLSVEVEQKLAAGRSAQIPLHPGVSAPDSVLRLEDIKAMEVDWNDVAKMITLHGEWLQAEFEGQGSEESGDKGRLFLYLVLGAFAAMIVVFLIRKRS
ncbi:MAG: extracellular solute-binding protein [Planctomycetota bacterium]